MTINFNISSNSNNQLSILGTLSIQEFVSKLAEEAESNPSDFIKNFTSDLLQIIAFEVNKIEKEVQEINLVNPFVFPKS